MGLLDKVERGIEKAVRNVFSTGSRARVEPVEIASKLRRELDNQSITIAAGRTLAPNVFDVLLSNDDFARAQEWGTPLAEELCDVVIQHVRSQGYTLQGPVRISFRRNEEERAGHFEIASRTEKSGGAQQAPRPNVPAAPVRQPTRLQPVLDIGGQRYSLNAQSVVLGRTTWAVDLGSTNGSYVNGHKVDGSVELTDGSTITMGRTKIIFRLLPQNPGGNA